MTRSSGEAGFTLVEVMVSLMTFGMIAAAGVAILSFSVKAQSSTGARLDDISALTRTMSILSADLAQASNRSSRDESGTSVSSRIEAPRIVALSRRTSAIAARLKTASATMISINVKPCSA